MKLEYVFALVVVLLMSVSAIAQDAPPACVGGQCTVESAPVAESTTVHAHAAGHRDFVLFDGDGYLIDQRAEAAASGDCCGLFPRLRARLAARREAAAAGEFVRFQPIRNLIRARRG